MRRLAAAALLLFLWTQPAQGSTVWVLGPGAEADVRNLAGNLAEATGWLGGPIRIEGSRVLLTLIGKDGRAATVVVTHGGATLPPGWDAETQARAQTALEGKLPWIQAGGEARQQDPGPRVAPADGARQGAVQAARLGALDRRRGGAVAETELTPCPACARAGQGAPGDLLRAHRARPKLWVQAALDAHLRGRRTEAVALADVASRMARPDADALRLWSRLTGKATLTEDGAEPARIVSRPSELLGGSPALVLLAGLILLGLAMGSRSRIALGGLGLAFVAGVGAWTWVNGEVSRPSPIAPNLPEALVAPLAGGPCEADPALWSPKGWRLYATCRGKPFTLDIEPAAGTGYRATGHHRVVVRGRDQGPALESAVSSLLTSLRQAEAAGFRANGRPPDTDSRVLPLPRGADHAQLAYSAALVAAGAVLALLLLGAMCRVIFQAVRQDVVLRWGLAAAGLGALLLPILLPDRMVMVYTGYDLVERLLLQGEIPRYGAGSVWLYRPFFAWLGSDHASMQVANRVFGVLTLVPLTVWALALLGGRRRGVLGVVFLYVLLPLVWRDHVSEAIGAGTVWLLVTGLGGFTLAAVDEGRRHWVWLSVPVLVAAMTCRPEAVAAGALAAVGIAVMGRFAARSLAAGALAAAPQVLWLFGSIARQVGESGIVAPGGAATQRLPSVLLSDNVFLEGPWLGPALLVWVVAAAWSGRRMLPAVAGLAAAALVWIGATAVDLPLVSIPRVHLPAVILLLPLAGLGIEVLAPRRLVQAAVALLVVWGGAMSVTPLLAKSNADHEDDLIRIAQEALPPGEGCLTTMGFEDPPSVGHTQRHFPHYLFPGQTLVGLERFDETWPTCEGQAVALLGTRCFMAFRQPGEAAPPSPGELPACAAFRQRYDLETVHERTIPNRTEHTFPMYPDAESLTVGVYRVRGPRP